MICGVEAGLLASGLGRTGLRQPILHHTELASYYLKATVVQGNWRRNALREEHEIMTWCLSRIGIITYRAPCRKWQCQCDNNFYRTEKINKRNANRHPSSPSRHIPKPIPPWIKYKPHAR